MLKLSYGAYLFGYGAQDFFYGCDAAGGLIKTVFAHSEHSLLLSLRLDDVTGARVENNLADSRRDGENLVDADTAFVSVFALGRRHGPIEGQVVERRPALHQFLIGERFERGIELHGAGDFRARGGINRIRFLILTELAYEPLAHDDADGRDEEEGLDAHIDEARDGARGAVGVDGREHQVPGERGINRERGRLAVADLADHDDVRVLAHQRA
ncbi:MAG: hypothetical protein DDT22_01267 [candidate division WS2 bacterium]|nr:hypothetical protein [Candidatus Lithacetigena glycinireducens]